LLVNDDPFLLWSYKQQLEPFFNLHTAENGLQAFQIVSKQKVNFFDAVILDINMPIMDGYEACKLIN
jgi:CheY-like chemotaxis protein